MLPDDPMASVPEGVAVGQILANKYKVERVLGEGGMGVVFLATHVMLKSRVAMKFLLPQYVQDEKVVARFLREAQAAVSIKNRHVARVSDIGTLETGSPYMVMEYLEGMDLDDAIYEEGRIEDPYRIVRLLLQACEGLAAAHNTGIVHRDIKPGNLFLTIDDDGTEQVKILDFGISKVEQTNNALTRTGTVMGSPMYMSPEQMRNSRKVDQRTDVWAIGVVAFQMATGNLPYEAEQMAELIAMVLEHDPPRASMFRPDIPPELDDVIAGALTKNIEERYQTVLDMARDLATVFGDDESVTRLRRIERMAASASGLTVTQPTGAFETVRVPTQGGTTRGLTATGGVSHIRSRTMPPEEQKSKTPIIVSAIVLALLAGAGLAVALTRGTEEAAAPPAPAPVAAPAPAPAPVPAAMVEAPEPTPEPVVADPAPAPEVTPEPAAAETPTMRRRPRPRPRPAMTEAPMMAPPPRMVDIFGSRE